ncbi:MAG: hypothetical protein RSB38_00165 [Oscillospiraceae bacterium]
MKNYKGLRFGNLFVIEKTAERNSIGEIIWLCRCDCGNTIKVKTSSLTNYKVTSCGCEKKDNENVDITNKRFGMLVALEPQDDKLNNNTLWLCRCDCGNFITCEAFKIRYGYKITCGCTVGLQERVPEISI